METKNNSANIYPSFFSQLLKWWFLIMPKNIFLAVRQTIANTFDYFSIVLLLKTLFSPWKRDIISTENLTLGEKFQVMVMNLVSRIIGAIVRTATIFAGIIVIIFELVIGAVIMVGFILTPPIAILILIYTFI